VSYDFPLTPENLLRNIVEYEESVGVWMATLYLRVSSDLVRTAQEIVGSHLVVIDSEGRAMFDGEPLENVVVGEPPKIIEMPDWPVGSWSIAPS
jgi:hypothetical protein